MYLKYRPIRLEDLPEGLNSIRDQFAYDEATQNQLLALWREVIVSGAANATLIEDLDRPAGRRFYQFCIILFLKPEFVTYLKTSAPAPVGRAILEAYLAGERPWLSLPEVRRANSEKGVTWVPLHSGPSQAVLNSPEWPIVGAKITDYSPWAIGSYRVNEFLLELYSDTEYAYADSFGMKLCREQILTFASEPDTRARLYYLTREQALGQVGTASAELFHYEQPRFFFSPSEQELLWCGLYGETDEELSEQLRIAVATVKKRWAGIYARVAAVAPELLGGSGDDARRGGGKKRRLTYYLRHHLSELRPHERPKTRASRHL
jgi:DNA-binding CsgD family transcriptional regulator